MHDGVFYRRTAMSCCPVTMSEMDEILEAMALLLTANSKFASRELKWLKERGLVQTPTRTNHVLQWLCEEGIIRKEGHTYYQNCPNFLEIALEALETLPTDPVHPTHFAGELARIQRFETMRFMQGLLKQHAE